MPTSYMLCDDSLMHGRIENNRSYNPLLDLGQLAPTRSREFEDKEQMQPTLMHELRCFYDSEYRLLKIQEALKDEMRKRGLGTKALFDDFGTNGSEAISKEDLINAIQRVLHVTVRQADMDNIDENDDELIDIDEFHHFIFSTSSGRQWRAQPRRQDKRDKNNDVRLLQRDMIRFDPVVLNLLRGFWLVCDKDRSGYLDKNEYIDYHMNLYASLHVAETRTPGWQNYARRNAEKEWESDVQGNTRLDQCRFQISLYQIVDAYIDGEPSKENVAKFLCFLLDLVTVDTRPDEAIEATGEGERRVKFRWEVDKENWLKPVEKDATKVSENASIGLKLEDRIEAGARKMLILVPQLDESRSHIEKKRRQQPAKKSIDTILNGMRLASKCKQRKLVIAMSKKRGRKLRYMAATLAMANRIGGTKVTRRHSVNEPITLPTDSNEKARRRRHTLCPTTSMQSPASLEQNGARGRQPWGQSLTSKERARTPSPAVEANHVAPLSSAEEKRLCSRADIDNILDSYQKPLSEGQPGTQVSSRRRFMSFDASLMLGDGDEVRKILQDGNIAALISSAQRDIPPLQQSPKPVEAVRKVIINKSKAKVVSEKDETIQEGSEFAQVDVAPEDHASRMPILESKKEPFEKNGSVSNEDSASDRIFLDLNDYDHLTGDVSVPVKLVTAQRDSRWTGRMSLQLRQIRPTPTYHKMQSLFVCSTTASIPSTGHQLQTGVLNGRMSNSHLEENALSGNGILWLQSDERRRAASYGSYKACGANRMQAKVEMRRRTLLRSGRRPMQYSITLQTGKPINIKLEPAKRRTEPDATMRRMPGSLLQMSPAAANALLTKNKRQRRISENASRMCVGGRCVESDSVEASTGYTLAEEESRASLFPYRRPSLNDRSALFCRTFENRRRPATASTEVVLQRHSVGDRVATLKRIKRSARDPVSTRMVASAPTLQTARWESSVMARPVTAGVAMGAAGRGQTPKWSRLYRTQNNAQYRNLK